MLTPDIPGSSAAAVLHFALDKTVFILLGEGLCWQHYG